MFSIDRYGLNSASLNLSFTTSSGDKIDLSLKDSIEASSSFKKNRGLISEEFTLKHTFEYKFHYEGNGLDKNDIKEIKEALKKAKPLIEKFLKEKNSNEKVMTNIAHSIKSFLPKPKNINHENAIKNKTVDVFDKILKQIKATFEETEKAKKLFDKIFNNDNNFDLFV
ncbi:conserved hypothetical protein [Lebetimonas natsushimae]|uniref:Uncharacterized protein n=1 Tax=Lebetimonas natsushimae TaxID=1936991 RepID=A0A292YIL0_9BACT|nr:ATP/GTP-binding protein [Lebetimonas natsushimae]GAX88365.1 conserved hypothetical protein [Lebetimonas natsushimae]